MSGDIDNASIAQPDIMVSIVCAAYNHGRFLRAALAGFLMQKTGFKYEIILHDDASTDGTTEIVEEYVSKYPTLFKSIIQVENVYSKGIKPWTICFTEAKGKYIALCEGDDYWTDSLKLQKQVDFLENNKDVSLSGHRVKVLRNGQIEDDNFGPGTYDMTHLIAKGRVAHTPSYVFRNVFKTDWGVNAMEHLLGRGALSGDVILLLLLSVKGSVHVLEDCMAVYRKHSSGVTNSERFKSQYNLGSYLLLKSFDDFTDNAFIRITAPARKRWLQIILSRDIRFKNKLNACRHAFNEGYGEGLKFLLLLPYYFLKASMYRFKK